MNNLKLRAYKFAPTPMKRHLKEKNVNTLAKK